MRDRDLDERINQVLAKLARLSEVAAAKIGRTSSDSDSEGIPAGVDKKLRAQDPDRPPPKDRSLYDYYAWQFARARTDSHRRVLLFLAETDLDQRVKQYPGKFAERTAKPDEIGKTRNKRIVDWYEGIDSLEVAVLESAHAGYCSEENVKTVRRQDRRDERTGRKLPGWAGWDDETRTKKVGELLGKKRSLGAIAIELGTAKSNVQRVVDRIKRGRRRAA